MEKNLSKPEISDYVLQRGTGKSIDINQAIVYDFMPVILGEMFRNDDVLSKMLLRPAPAEGPFMLQANAYEKLGSIYLMHEDLIPALECYRFYLDGRAKFKNYMWRIQNNALLNSDELDFLQVPTDFEMNLAMSVLKLNRISDRDAYALWVENLRNAKHEVKVQRKNDYGSVQHVEACLKIGEYAQAFSMAEILKNPELITKVKNATPNEILDVNFLHKYMADNHPPSTFGSSW